MHYLLGNPPFGGAKIQSKEQRSQVHRIARLAQNGGTLDYVTAWFIKAGEYIRGGVGRIGFVATNSITQGEQAGQFWPILFGRSELEIAFAHRTFAWGSDARGKAQVHVVIVGLDAKEGARTEKRLFSYPDLHGEPQESQHSAITPYLLDGSGLSNPQITVQEESHPINGLKEMTIGSQPIDGGHYIFEGEERAKFLELEPGVSPYLRPYVGAREFLQGESRWILALQNAPPNVLAQLPLVQERIAAVRAYRDESMRTSTIKLSQTPTLYQVNVIPDEPFLVIPRVSSERREYIPIGWLLPPVIPSDAVLCIQDATLVDFALLTSAMHMVWVRVIGGRLKSDYRYSVDVVYNTFLLPSADANLTLLKPLAQAILDARAVHQDATLSNLYDPNLMPPNLRQAHQKLDRAVDRLYRQESFKSEQERIDDLLTRYENTHDRASSNEGNKYL